MGQRVRRGALAPGVLASRGRSRVSHSAVRPRALTSSPAEWEAWAQRAVDELLELYYPNGKPSQAVLDFEAQCSATFDQLLAFVDPPGSAGPLPREKAARGLAPGRSVGRIHRAERTTGRGR